MGRLEGGGKISLSPETVVGLTLEHLAMEFDAVFVPREAPFAVAVVHCSSVGRRAFGA